MPHPGRWDAGQDADFRVDVPWVSIGTHNEAVQVLSVVKDQQQPPFEGFSDRVTEGNDDDRTAAYGRWLKRLRDSQAASGAEESAPGRDPNQGQP